MKNYLSRFFSDKNFRHKAIQWVLHGKFINLFHAYLDNLFIRFINLWGVPKVTCSVCGWRGTRFESIATMEKYRPSALCPSCGSLERHRALFDILKKRDILSTTLSYLEIAPVPGIARLLRSKVKYTSLDYGSLQADVRGDVQYLPFPPKIFDVILCFHVLEFVKDWQKAICEFVKTLTDGGVLILSENFMGGQKTTVEYNASALINGSPPRRFGEDFPETLESLGFNVERIDYLGYYDERGDYFFICSVPQK